VARQDWTSSLGARVRGALLFGVVGSRAADGEAFARCRRTSRSAYAAWFLGRFEVAALLYRAAIEDLGRLVKSAHPLPDGAGVEDWLEAHRALELPLDATTSRDAATLLSGATPGLTNDERLTADRLKAVAECLLGAPQLWPPGAVRRERWRRCAATLALLAMPLCVLAWRLWPEPVNLARGKAVSGVAAAYDSSLAGVTDGIVMGSIGFHSASTRKPWLTIDLGRVVQVKSLTIYGRGDCCFEQSLPLVLQLAGDDGSFVTVAERDERFTAYAPWTVRVGHRARFVKLVAPEKDLLVVSEVEVFGE
jgi:hypothetical protein